MIWRELFRSHQVIVRTDSSYDYDSSWHIVSCLPTLNSATVHLGLSLVVIPWIIGNSVLLYYHELPHNEI